MGTYSIVRPYPGALGEKVERFVEKLELTPALGQPPGPGTPDQATARFLSRAVAKLLVVPFHFHRGARQARLDGVGVLQALPPSADFSRRVLFMPVGAFSWTTSLQPRLQTLRETWPRLYDQLIVAHEGDLESPALLLRVKRALDAAEAARSRPPGSVKSRPTPAEDSGDRLAEPLLRLSLGPEVRTRRVSGAWKFSIPAAPDPDGTTISTMPPHSGKRLIEEPPRSGRPIYLDFAEDFSRNKKASG